MLKWLNLFDGVTAAMKGWFAQISSNLFDGVTRAMKCLIFGSNFFDWVTAVMKHFFISSNLIDLVSGVMKGWFIVSNLFDGVTGVMKCWFIAGIPNLLWLEPRAFDVLPTSPVGKALNSPDQRRRLHRHRDRSHHCIKRMNE